MEPVIGERPPVGRERAAVQLSRGEGASMEVDRQKLGADQQPKVREIAVGRGCVGRFGGDRS